MSSHQTPSIIYHYCSLDAFVSIINNHNIRLSNLYKTNDWSEKRYYGQMVIDYLSQRCSLNQEDISKLNIRLEELTNPTIGQTLSYACCFSEVSDSLSQWRMYGDNGFGVCIGFDVALLKKLRANTILSFDRVLYPKQFRRSDWDDRVLSSIDSIPKDKYNLTFVFDMLMARSAFYKDPSYQMEKEWRIVVSSDKQYGGLIDVVDPIDQIRMKHWVYSWREDCGFSLSGLKTTTMNRQLYSYLELGFSGVTKDLIKRIVLGPSSLVHPHEVYELLCENIPIETDDLSRLMDKTRYDRIKRIISVEKSIIPYRG
ncbi:MAG: DUF2971 domain-containing protein [Clostridia bacterium]|nr:DUF2971 domain-containing protein [Clostridia bacterium]